MIAHALKVAALALLFTTATAWSSVETPTAVAGVKVISVDEGKTLASARGAAFFDTRNAMNFGKGHVPGAVSASYKEKSDKVADFDASKDDFDLSKLPADKNAKLVFYSDGPTGWKSYKAAVLAAKAGYRNVMYMRSGFADWEAKGLPVER
jgi:rhodanese-related sulfurtransferase